MWFYRTMSELLDGEASILFAELVADELAHVAKLDVIRGGASREQLSRDLPRAMLERHAPGGRTRRT